VGPEAEMKGFRFERTSQNLPNLPRAYPPVNGSAALPSKESEERRTRTRENKRKREANLQPHRGEKMQDETD